jgi:hypothetical protein
MLYVCGSFRFLDEMERLENILKNAKIDYLISKKADASGIVGCLEKIEKADVVYIINPDGYIGKSVSVDIGYAFAKDKEIYAMYPIDDPPVMNLVKGVLSFQSLVNLLKH